MALAVLDLNSDGIRAVGTHVCHQSDAAKLVPLLAVAVYEKVEHGLARRVLVAGMPCPMLDLSGSVKSNAVRIELAVPIEHLLRKRQSSVQERVDIVLCLS